MRALFFIVVTILNALCVSAGATGTSKISLCAAMLSADDSNGEPQLRVTTVLDGVKNTEYFDRTNRPFTVAQKLWSAYGGLLDDKALPHQNILDLGTGGGAFISGLINHARQQHIPLGKIVGVDVILDQDQQSGPYKHAFQEASAFALPFEDSSFDIVHAMETVFAYYSFAGLADSDPEVQIWRRHRELWDAALNEVYRVTRNHGHVLMTLGTSNLRNEKYDMLARDKRFKIVAPLKTEDDPADIAVVLEIIKQ